LKCNLDVKYARMVPYHPSNNSYQLTAHYNTEMYLYVLWQTASYFLSVCVCPITCFKSSQVNIQQWKDILTMLNTVCELVS